MADATAKKTKSKRLSKGFVRTSGVLQGSLRAASEKRGFAESRLLTQWAEIVGTAFAKMADPVKISYGKGGLGATLTLLTTGAHAPVLQAELPKIRDRVNACYGYSAISRIKITQTSPVGFADPQATFQAATRPNATRSMSDADAGQLTRDVSDVGDTGLRDALEALGQNILSRPAT